MKMKFRLNIDPPTATAQEKKVTVRNGRALVYKSTNAKMAEQILRMALASHRPTEPMDGPLQLIVWWVFPRPKCCKKAALWKITRPDTDNLNKGLKDIMTSLKYWHDDAQVCKETILKCYGDNPGIEINIESLEGETEENDD